MTTPREWQPIETAPRDGTTILLHGRAYSSDDQAYAREHHVGWWQDDHECWMGRSFAAYIIPTHWMPLPAPPDSSTVEPAAVNSFDEGRELLRACAEEPQTALSAGSKALIARINAYLAKSEGQPRVKLSDKEEG